MPVDHSLTHALQRGCNPIMLYAMTATVREQRSTVAVHHLLGSASGAV